MFHTDIERHALCEQCSYVHALHMDGISTNLLILPFLQHIEEVVSYTNLNVNISATKGRTTLSSLIMTQMTFLCKTPEHINR